MRRNLNKIHSGKPDLNRAAAAGCGSGHGRRGQCRRNMQMGIELGMRLAGLDLAGTEALELHMAKDGSRVQGVRHPHDQEVFHTLLRHHEDIYREITNAFAGIKSLTTSDNPEMVRILHDHMPAMHQRLQENFGLR